MSLLNKYDWVMSVVLIIFITMLETGFCTTGRFWAVVAIAAIGHMLYRHLDRKHRKNERMWRLIEKRF